MITNSIVTPELATVTEAALFGLMLDAPVRGPLSSLNPSREFSNSMRDRLYGYFESACLDEEIPEQVIDALSKCEDPSLELETAIAELQWLVHALTTLQREFHTLCEHVLRLKVMSSSSSGASERKVIPRKMPSDNSSISPAP